MCPTCGRALQAFEVCECASKLPKDGLRATCPRFKARSSYRGAHYISCGGSKYKFGCKESRDLHYMVFCCGGIYDSCQGYGGKEAKR